MRDWLVLLIYSPVARGDGGGGGAGMITWLQSRLLRSIERRNKGGNGPRGSAA